MLLGLAPRQRAALVLLDLYGYGSEEAGEIMGIRPSTVRALATQGRSRRSALPEARMAELKHGLRDGRRTQIEPDDGRVGPTGAAAPAFGAQPQGGRPSDGSRDHCRDRVVRRRRTGARQRSVPCRRYRRGAGLSPTFTIVSNPMVLSLRSLPGIRRRRDAGPLTRWHDDCLHRSHDWSSSSQSRHDATGRHRVPHPYQRPHRRASSRDGHRTEPSWCTSERDAERQPPPHGDGCGWVRSRARSRERNSNMADFNPPDWSPDGSRILFTSFHGGPPLLATIPVVGWPHPNSSRPGAAGRRSVVPGRLMGARSHSRVGSAIEDGVLVFEVWVMNADGSGEPSSGRAARSQRRSSRVVTGWEQGRLHRDRAAGSIAMAAFST